MLDLTFEEALEKADALKALGHTEIYLHDWKRTGTTLPWSLATGVEEGSSFRFSGPASVYIVAEHPSGLTFKWSVDFEEQDANGKGVSLFDRARLRDVMGKLPENVREAFAEFLRDKVMPDLASRTAKLREAMNQQIDSEDCVRGLIAFGLPS